MLPRESTNTLELIHTIKCEIDRLSEKQAEALKTATYLGMTPDEAKEYDRRERIAELVHQMQLLNESQ